MVFWGWRINVSLLYINIKGVTLLLEIFLSRSSNGSLKESSISKFARRSTFVQSIMSACDMTNQRPPPKFKLKFFILNFLGRILAVNLFDSMAWRMKWTSCRNCLCVAQDWLFSYIIRETWNRINIFVHWSKCCLWRFH